jgi:hypothetical protein
MQRRHHGESVQGTRRPARRPPRAIAVSLGRDTLDLSRRVSLTAAVLAVPLVVAGYVGLTVLLVLPLLGLRGMLPHRYVGSGS